jgi:hypothetical protein
LSCGVMSEYARKYEREVKRGARACPPTSVYIN